VYLPGTSGPYNQFQGLFDYDHATVKDLSTGESGEINLAELNGFRTPIPVHAGDQLQVVTQAAIRAPSAVVDEVASVSTSSDGPATTAYEVPVAKQSVSNVTASLTPANPGATNTSYTISFRASSGGSLAAHIGSIAIDLPGTSGPYNQFQGYYDYDNAIVKDLTTGESGEINLATLNGFATPIVIHAGDQVEVITQAVITDPSAATVGVASVATSSDNSGTATYEI
jgi:hypothetical protein